SYCEGKLIKHGKTKQLNQRYKCKNCNKTQVEQYKYKAYQPSLKNLHEMKKNRPNFIKETASSVFETKVPLGWLLVPLPNQFTSLYNG
ncbi:MAG: hypothetical protein M0P09_07255, partial [Acholeplasmataceae bacterium]|nr:hypothetical protein [Acholeplasmataceae bacterium]